METNYGERNRKKKKKKGEGEVVVDHMILL
jgi:hypothetical protein